MPNFLELEEEDEHQLSEDGEGSSDESGSGDDSGDDSSDEDSDDESGSDSDDDSGSDDDDDDGSGSDSDSDSDDDDSDDDSGSDSSSGSDSDDSSKKKKKSKKSKKSKSESKEDPDEKDDDSGVSAIFRIQQISSKMSFLLDDLHRTFKPKSIPKIDPQSVFPYHYSSLPTDSPKRLWKTKPIRDLLNTRSDQEEKEEVEGPRGHFATHSKAPISSPLRHGDHVDRGAGGTYIYPSYAAPPTRHEIKKLYKNYSDQERHKIAENQQRERERKFVAARRSRRDIAWEYETGNFSEEFIAASNRRRNSPKRTGDGVDGDGDYGDENAIDDALPTTFDELYKHYDAERRLIEQKQNKMQRMKKKLYWFRKNNAERPLRVDEKEPLKKNNQFKNTTQPPRSTLSVKDREKNLLSKAAEVLLGNGTSATPKASNRHEVDGVEASPDSLQEKIMQIASEEEEDLDDGRRLPTFV